MAKLCRTDHPPTTVNPGRSEPIRHSSAIGVVGQAQRARSVGLPQGRADAVAYAHEQPHRRVAAASLGAAMKNIEALIDDGGEITLGAIGGIDCAATATDGHNSLAMLVRREGETLNVLLRSCADWTRRSGRSGTAAIPSTRSTTEDASRCTSRWRGWPPPLRLHAEFGMRGLPVGSVRATSLCSPVDRAPTRSVSRGPAASVRAAPQAGKSQQTRAHQRKSRQLGHR